MKFSVGDDYKDAVMNRPVTGVRKFDSESIAAIKSRHAVVLDYKSVQNSKTRYYWVRKGPYCYYVLDRKNKKYIKEEDTGKNLCFKSIRKAMGWIYEKDKEYYDGLVNLSNIIAADASNK